MESSKQKLVGGVGKWEGGCNLAQRRLSTKAVGGYHLAASYSRLPAGARFRQEIIIPWGIIILILKNDMYFLAGQIWAFSTK